MVIDSGSPKAVERAREHYVAPTGLAVAYAGLHDSTRAVHWFVEGQAGRAGRPQPQVAADGKVK